MTPEGRISKRVKDQARRLGLVAIRQHFAPGAAAGWPDFAILGPNGRTLWLETKAPGKPLRPLQDVRREEIIALGHFYAKPDTVEMVDDALRGFVEYCGALHV